MPAPPQVPVTGTAHALYFAELAADADVCLHGIRSLALQLEYAFTTVLAFYGKHLVHWGIQVVDARLDNVGSSIIHIIPVVAHHVSTRMQGACGTPRCTSCIVGTPSQGKTFFGFGQVLVNLLVNLVGSGFGYIGVSSFHYLESN